METTNVTERRFLCLGESESCHVEPSETSLAISARRLLQK